MKKENKIRRLFLKAKSYKLKAGFSLVEMLFYVALLSLALFAVIQTLLIMVRSYGSLRSAQAIERDAGIVLERILREARDAKDIDEGGSVLGTSPGELLLTTTNASGTPRTVEFYVENGQVKLKEDGVVSGALTGNKTTVSTLVFRKITTGRSKGVKIEFRLSGSGSPSREENFDGTAVLRDSY